jgi:hypothetical protein
VLSVAGEGVAVGLGHWFNELGLRVSFGDAFLRFLLVGFVFPAALTRIRRPAAARKVAGFANHPFHSLFPSVPIGRWFRSTRTFGVLSGQFPPDFANQWQ